MAVHALQYLVTGKQHPEEFYLPLNKILCGMDVSSTLPQDIELTEDCKTACDDLLGAVIGHWTALKNTSPEGLQETFLNREGKLTFKDGQWTLVVERKTIDILMDRIPWSISMIKHSWMKQMINTEW